jgi:hypothetical protein
MIEKKIILKPLSPGELAEQYNVCVKTFRSWMVKHEHAIGERIGRYFSILQVREIYTRLGCPLEVYDERFSR